MEELKQYTEFQVNNSPSVYGAFTSIGAFMYFIFEYQWLAVIFSWLVIVSISYSEKPFRFILLHNKLKLILFYSLMSISLMSPVLVVNLGGALNEFIGMMLIPIGGLITAAFAYLIYDEKTLKENGWVAKK